MAARIAITTDKQFYFAGETISGQVFLVLNEPMNANEVLMKFKGWEQAKWIDENQILLDSEKQRVRSMCCHRDIFVRMDTSDSSSEQGEEEDSQFNYVAIGNTIKQVHRRKGGRIIVKTTNILHNFGGNFIPPAQYVFPFTYKTGENFPATFSRKASDRKSKGRIKYEMRVFVRGYQSHRRLIKNSLQILIRESNVIKNQQKEMEANVKSCCCINKGVSKIKCYFEKNGYIPGEEAKIFCELDNRGCQANVNNVTIKLINDINYTSKDNYHKTMKDVILASSFPGLPAGGEQQSEKTVRIQGHGEHAYIQPTARGERVRSVYYLKVEAELDASCTCCSELPIVEQSVVIYPYMNIVQNFEKPANWTPEMFSAVNLQTAITVKNEKLDQMQNPYY